MKIKFFYKRRSKVFSLIFFSSIISYLYFAIGVSKNISSEDIKITELLSVGNECSNIDSFNMEVKCIRNIQRAQLDLIKGKECRDEFNFFLNLGSIKILKENTACCFDRARITQQSLQYYGFKVRNIFLLNRKSNVFDILRAGIDSHATTEVLTSKGWLGVDSNEPFMLISKKGIPYTYEKAITSGLIKQHSDINFYKYPNYQFIGLYSRKGNFFAPYFLFLPELNYSDFFSNIQNIKLINPKKIDY